KGPPGEDRPETEQSAPGPELRRGIEPGARGLQLLARQRWQDQPEPWPAKDTIKAIFEARTALRGPQHVPQPRRHEIGGFRGHPEEPGLELPVFVELLTGQSLVLPL